MRRYTEVAVGKFRQSMVHEQGQDIFECSAVFCLFVYDAVAQICPIGQNAELMSLSAVGCCFAGSFGFCNRLLLLFATIVGRMLTAEFSNSAGKNAVHALWHSIPAIDSTTESGSKPYQCLICRL